MSREQANVYKKHRTAGDRAGDLAWSARISSRAVRASPEAQSRNIEDEFELNEDERLLWRLLRLPRRLGDLEKAGILDPDDLRAALRGFVAADVVDIVDVEQAKALLPAEVKRTRAELQGKAWRPPAGALVPKVYRPDIGLSDEGPAVVASAPPAPVAIASSPPAPPPTRPLLPAEKKIKEQLESSFKTMGTLDHYAFLGVPQTADEGTIRSAYVNLAREYHPDRLAGTPLAEDPTVRAQIEALFKRLGEAHKTLTSPESRARYDRELRALATTSSEPSSPTARPRRPVEARNAYLMAETFFKKKDYRQAEMHYRQAALFDGEEPMILAALAWCIYLNPDHPAEHRIADAKKRLEDVLKKHKNAEAAYRLGRVLRDAGDEEGALRRFEDALRINPSHVDAQREVRLAEARKQKAEQERLAKEEAEKGLLHKLFKR